MGVNISEIIPRKEIEITELKGKVVAIDAFNTLYQFLTTIRQPDGTSLMDSKGRITSHLSGLFYRTINLLIEGVKPVFVFDGKPPELKMAELAKRKEAKIRAMEKYEIAKKDGDSGEMRKYSGRFVKITEEIIQESKDLLSAMGVPWIQAESEGEAEASVLARNNMVWAAASQDYDALLYGTPILIRNLTLARRRKNGAGIYIDIGIEKIEFSQVLNSLGIDRDQLICLAILVGTDYNPGGVKGLGQKKSLEIVQRNKYPLEIFDYVERNESLELNFDWKIIFKQFKDYSASFEETIVFGKVNEEALRKLLSEHDFSINRIDSGLEKLRKINDKKKQKGLGDFF
ncbi:flap endonuclease-1 [archaeon]|jgi:flap endonuclease-1|nr:flap endonuclease-1 [archaeon]MBT6606591.1 flap endonuclease-1 [archaeon]MBT7251782.1 flap endonuclease-1 [archaeon]MBT7660803.1 flap endonuclease-1 [archaeon]